MTTQKVALSLDFMLTHFGHDAVTEWLAESDGWAPLIDSLEIPEHGTYTRHLVGATDAFELYFIVWGSYADSGFHGHPEGGCWMRVIQGYLYETTPDGVQQIRASGSVGFQKGVTGIHRIETRGPAISVHVYAPQALPSKNVLV